MIDNLTIELQLIRATKPSIDEQIRIVGDRLPMAWAVDLTRRSTDPRESESSLFKFLHENRGLHPEYAALLWLHDLRKASICDALRLRETPNQLLIAQDSK